MIVGTGLLLHEIVNMIYQISHLLFPQEIVCFLGKVLNFVKTRRTAGLRPAFCSLLSLPNRFGYKV